MTFRVPPLLESYLALPPETSLIVLTSVLGASTNWLVLRYLYSTLVPAAHTGGRTLDLEMDGEIGNADMEGIGSGGDKGDGAAVVLVSFLRDLGFWREGARRLVSLGQPFWRFWLENVEAYDYVCGRVWISQSLRRRRDLRLWMG